MNTTVIFNTDKKLKAAAMKKARAQGLTLSALLNTSMHSFVNNTLKIDALSLQLE